MDRGRRRRRPFARCLGLFGVVAACVLFVRMWVEDGTALRGSFRSVSLPSDNHRKRTTASGLVSRAPLDPDPDTPYGPPLEKVRAAFSKLCPRATVRPDNLPCSARGLRRIRQVLPSSLPGLRTSPCGQGNVVAKLRVGDAVQHGAPKLFHLVDEMARVPLICTFPPHEDKWVSQSIQTTGIWDAPLATFFVRTLTQRHQGTGIVLDVGANIGSMTLISAVLGYRTFAFEASKRSAHLLARTVAINHLENRVSVLNNALGDGLYFSRLVVPRDNRGGSAVGLSQKEYGTNINEKAGATTEENHISVVCLDTVADYLDVVLPAEGLPRVVILLKIDVERLEPLVIRGGAEFFSRFDVKTVVLEISSYGWGVIGCDVQGVVGAMLEIGYVMTTQDGTLVQNLEDFAPWSERINLSKTQVNVVFTRKLHPVKR
eukprot:g5044.t1